MADSVPLTPAVDKSAYISLPRDDLEQFPGSNSINNPPKHYLNLKHALYATAALATVIFVWLFNIPPSHSSQSQDPSASAIGQCASGTCIPTPQQEAEMFNIIYNFITTCETGGAFYDIGVVGVIPRPVFIPTTDIRKVGGNLASDCVATMIQLAWHDAATYASPLWMAANPLEPQTGNGIIGGSHACLFVPCTDAGQCEYTAQKNNPIRQMIDAELELYFRNGLDLVVSLADFSVYAASVAIFYAARPALIPGIGNDPTAFPIPYWGRQDCAVAFAGRFTTLDASGLEVPLQLDFRPLIIPASGPLFPDARMPDPDKGIEEVEKRMRTSKGDVMSQKDVAALTGAHAVGRMYYDETGFAGSWTATPGLWDGDDYYNTLINYPWIKANVPPNALAPAPNNAGRVLWVKTGDQNMILNEWLVYDKSFMHSDMSLYFVVAPDVSGNGGVPGTNNDCGGCNAFPSDAANNCGSCGSLGTTSPYFGYSSNAHIYQNNQPVWRQDFARAWLPMTAMGTEGHCDASLNIPAGNPAVLPPNDPACFPALTISTSNFVPVPPV